jgi:glyoxylase-like metal-dependent hydrolase (beta-lactamase superfamily II)
MKAEVFSVTPTIWCVRRKSYFTCSYIVAAKIGTVLIDAGMDSTGKDMLDGLAFAGLSLTSIKAILLTHWHNDHTAGARILQEKSGANVYYHKNENPFLDHDIQQRDWRGEISQYIPELGVLVLLKGLLGKAVPVPVKASKLLSDREMIFDAFQVIETPGHTTGHLCYYYLPEKVLFAGDALAVVNNRVRFMARPVTPDLRTARESMKKCLDFEIDVICPGHRNPLVVRTRERCAEMQNKLQTNNYWPLWG